LTSELRRIPIEALDEGQSTTGEKMFLAWESTIIQCRDEMGDANDDEESKSKTGLTKETLHI
jgi:hypothetical protein